MKNKIVNIMGLVGGIAIFIGLTSSLIKSIKRIRMGDDLIKKTAVKLEKLNEENKKLALQAEVVQSEEFMEKQLRNKLGLAKEGEIILVLPEADILRKLSPIVPKDEEAPLKPNWQKWIDLFI